MPFALRAHTFTHNQLIGMRSTCHEKEQVSIMKTMFGQWPDSALVSDVMALLSIKKFGWANVGAA